MKRLIVSGFAAFALAGAAFVGTTRPASADLIVVLPFDGGGLEVIPLFPGEGVPLVTWPYATPANPAPAPGVQPPWFTGGVPVLVF